MCDYCSWIDQILARIKAETTKPEKKPHVHVDPVVAVHGGAGKIPRKKRERMLLEVKKAAIEAYKDLINGRSAVDAVEKAISHMESAAYFNCAKGGSLDVNDEVVTDAAIVIKNDAGCVGGVRDIEHPITLARKVLENTEHVLIVENGAQKFALDNGIQTLPPGSLVARESVTSQDSGEEGVCSFESCTGICRTRNSDDDALNASELRDFTEGEAIGCDSECVLIRSCGGEAPPCYELSIDSEDLMDASTVLQAGAVGAVAFDRKKRLASGTSTAGEPGKPVGCISPIATVIGCGVYADEHGCVSVSGNETGIYCHAPARRIIRRLSRDVPIKSAVNMELDSLVVETGDVRIGAVALDAVGEPCISFQCMHFPWALCRKGCVHYGSRQGEQFWEKVEILERPLDCMCNTSDDD
ncbi:isoaspartyl peptidase/L-asparaginase [Andrena cerasifolii]|uniref:isoaspartyl peptidase/L-asparaginase n=1 Tax=Andrena cerasifolii TaxID=2819439 RepID=UPI00403782CB